MNDTERDDFIKSFPQTSCKYRHRLRLVHQKNYGYWYYTIYQVLNGSASGDDLLTRLYGEDTRPELPFEGFYMAICQSFHFNKYEIKCTDFFIDAQEFLNTSYFEHDHRTAPECPHSTRERVLAAIFGDDCHEGCSPLCPLQVQPVELHEPLDDSPF